MKIAIIADRLVMGGLETHIVSTVNELLRRGYQILLNAAYIAPEILAQIEDSRRLFKSITWSDNPVNDLREFNPDIVHSHPFTAIFRGFEVVKALNRPFVITMHGLYDFGLDRSPLGNQVCERVNSIIAVDHRVADLLKGSIAHPEKVTVIPNGIDTQKFQPLVLNKLERLQVGLQPDWFTLVVVSRMADGKETPIYQLINCATELAKQLKGLNLLLVGDGCFFGEVQAKVESLKRVPQLNIKLLGRIDNIVRFLAMADLVLACDRAAMEAMACQRAVLAMNAEGFAGSIDYNNYQEILLKRSGYRQLSNIELVKTVLEIVNNYLQWEQLASNGTEIVKRYFDIRQVVTQLEADYYRMKNK